MVNVQVDWRRARRLRRSLGRRAVEYLMVRGGAVFIKKDIKCVSALKRAVDLRALSDVQCSCFAVARCPASFIALPQCVEAVSVSYEVRT